jgi:hypothetical protein
MEFPYILEKVGMSAKPSLLIDTIFGGGTDPSRLPGVKISQLREIVAAAKEALGRLDPDERNCMIDFFGLHSIEGFEKDLYRAGQSGHSAGHAFTQNETPEPFKAVAQGV